MGKNAVYGDSEWRIYDISLGTEISSADNAGATSSDGSCKRERRLYAAAAVRDDSAFGGTKELQVSRLD